MGFSPRLPTEVSGADHLPDHCHAGQAQNWQSLRVATLPSEM